MKIMLHDPQNRLPKNWEGCVLEWKPEWRPFRAYKQPEVPTTCDPDEVLTMVVLNFWPTRRWAGKAQVWEAWP